MSERTLAEWLEQLPANADTLRIRAGDKKDPPTLATWQIEREGIDYDALATRVQTLADEGALGWTYMRCDALGVVVDDEGRKRRLQVDTWSDTQREAPAGSAIGEAALASALIAALRENVAMAREMRQSHSSLSTALASALTGERETMMAFLNEHMHRAEMQALSAQLVATLEGEQAAGDPLRAEAARLLSALVGHFIGGGGGGDMPDADGDEAPPDADED
jgi:hypothetical protein